uniref:Uncharacterized protein n=1 Tax=Caenorhabditis japonica TaxID=281687 RepID=A0A8R1INV1_CAEJA
MIEVAFVCYLESENNMRRKERAAAKKRERVAVLQRKKDKKKNNYGATTVTNNNAADSDLRSNYDEQLPFSNGTASHKISISRQANNMFESLHALAQFGLLADEEEENTKWTAQNVDKFCRKAFPLSFCFLNLIYWCYYLYQNYLAKTEALAQLVPPS